MLHDNHPDIAITLENIGDSSVKINPKLALEVYEAALKILLKNSSKTDSILKKINSLKNVDKS